MTYQNRILQSKVIFLAISICTMIGSCSLKQEYDNFLSLKLILKSNKKQLSVGNEIILTATIESEKPRTIRVFKDRRKSFRIAVHKWSKNDVIFEESGFYGGFAPKIKNDEIEVIQIAANKPFEFQIKGMIREKEQNDYTFDFDKFGKFRKRKSGNVYIQGAWRAVNPEPGQSDEEYSTNRLIITVEPQP
jgi:hypothetical protein